MRQYTVAYTMQLAYARRNDVVLKRQPESASASGLEQKKTNLSKLSFQEGYAIGRVCECVGLCVRKRERRRMYRITLS